MTTRRLSVALCAILLLAGCHSIKLDPLDPTADVYVNGELKGRGQIEYTTPAHSYAGSIGIKVVPASGKPYTVGIERQLDWTYVLTNTIVSAGVAGALTFLELQAKQPPTALILLAESPLSFLTGYRVDDYYDLTKLKASQSSDLGASLAFRPLTPPLRVLGLTATTLPRKRLLGYATVPDYLAPMRTAQVL